MLEDAEMRTFNPVVSKRLNMFARSMVKTNWVAGSMVQRGVQRVASTSSSSSILHYESIGSADATRSCWIMHGVLGSGRNLRTLGKRIASTFPLYEVKLLDHRGHGKSPSMGVGPHDCAACADDVAALAAHLGGVKPDVLVGHSLGGKVALACVARARARRESSPRHVFMLDALPHPVLSSTSFSQELTVGQVIDCIRRVSMPAPSKEAVLAELTAMGMQESMVQWMSTNLKQVAGGGEGVDWVIDMEVVAPLFDDVKAVDFRNLCAAPPEDTTLHFVRAGKNTAWTPQVLRDFNDWKSSSRGRVQLSTLPDAGHWVHVDNPDELFNILAPAFE